MTWTTYWLRIFGDVAPLEIVVRFRLAGHDGDTIHTWLEAAEDACRISTTARAKWHDRAVTCLWLAGRPAANDNATGGD